MAIAKGEIKAFIKSKKITKVSNGVPTYGKDIETIEIGSWQITSAKIQLGEGDRTNVMQVDYFDPSYSVDKYLYERALLIGGIPVPEDLFKSSKDDEGGDSAIAGSTGTYNPKEGMKGDELAAEIVKYCLSVGVTDESHIASILGNITIETVMGQYTEEIGGANTRYAPYYGRGLIQITWRDNYERFGKFFGQDFVTNVDLVKQLKWAIPIAVGGTTGANGCPLFTGVKMSDFGGGASFDFVGSRKTVNGTDKDQLVAAESRNWLAKIKAGLGKGGKVNAIATPQPAKPAVSTATTTATPTAKVTAPTPDNDISEDIIEVELQLGFVRSDGKPEAVEEGSKKKPKNFNRDVNRNSLDDVITTNFYLTSRSTSSTQAGSTIGGRGIRYIINRTNRRTFHNISLRQLTKRFGEEYGIGTIIPPDSSAEKTITVLSQNDETDYQFLTRVAKAQGLEIKSNGKSLEIAKPKDAIRVKAKPEWGISLSSTESADASRIIKALPPIDSLVDGEAIGEGFATTMAIANPDLDVMSLQPGTILEIPFFAVLGFPSVYCREYKIKAINIEYKGAFAVTLSLYIPVNVKPTSQEKKNATDAKSAGSGNNSQIVAAASKYIDKEFNPGATEQCMVFTRAVLKDCNHPKAEFITKLPYDALDTGRNLASSLSGTDCGTVITSIAGLQPGDILFWSRTYGNFGIGTNGKHVITHVGIYAGNNEIIDRSTSARPVTKRSINTFPHFELGVRLSA